MVSTRDVILRVLPLQRSELLALARDGELKIQDPLLLLQRLALEPLPLELALQLVVVVNNRLLHSPLEDQFRRGRLTRVTIHEVAGGLQNIILK